MIVTKILENKEKEIEEAKSILSRDELIKRISANPLDRRPFSRGLKNPRGVGLIAELKKASPSAGIIRRDFEAVAIAQIYAGCGADAISVLTDKKYFQGAPETIGKVRNAVGLPVLRKDFIIDEYQIYESAFLGSDAVLLITDILSLSQLRSFLSLTDELGMEALVEVHNEEDLKKALGADAKIIGINNRDLHTFKVELDTTVRLSKLIPADKIKVSESGITKNEEVMFIRSLGIEAVLIGEAFLRSDDTASRVKEIMGRSLTP